MFPLLAMLVAVHVAMPIAERRWARGKVVESLDTVYLLALPVVAALTALAIAPSRAGARGAVLVVRGHLARGRRRGCTRQRREGMATHAIIGLLMLGFGLAARFRDLPWELVGTGHRGGGAGARGATLAIRAVARISRRAGAGARRGSHDQRARARRRQRAVLQSSVSSNASSAPA